MNHFPDSTYGGTREGCGLGAMFAVAVVLVLASMSAGMFVAGG